MTDKDDHDKFFGDARGTYVIQVIYFVFFTATYLWLFWELSKRWPVR